MNAAAAVWGLAEATLFFIVPDVLLTWVALDRPRRAFVACGWAVAGALAGGAVMYRLGGARTQETIAVVERVPAISRQMIERVHDDLADRGLVVIFPGAFMGIPYKIFAVQAGALGLGLLPFLVVSAAARLLRFAAITGLAVLITHRVRSPAARRIIHAALWAAFYGWYFLSFA